jgi:microcystin-dependent protein
MADFRAPPITTAFYESIKDSMQDVWARWLNDLYINVGGIRGTRRVAGEIIDIYGGDSRIPTGALKCDGKTIGNVNSGATARANADTLDLYIVLWEDFSESENAVSGGGRGTSAVSDFNNNKTIALPNLGGQVIGGTGTGTGLTQRDLGYSTGVEDVTLTGAQSGTSEHSHDITDSGHTHTSPAHTHGAGSYYNRTRDVSGGGTDTLRARTATSAGTTRATSTIQGTSGSTAATIDSNTTGITVDNSTEGNATEAHTNMQPTIFLTKAIFL